MYATASSKSTLTPEAIEEATVPPLLSIYHLLRQLIVRTNTAVAAAVFAWPHIPAFHRSVGFTTSLSELLDLNATSL